MTEAELLAAVVDVAHVYGYRVAHFRPALTRHGWRTPVAADGAGFPDLLLVQPGRIIAAELKSDAGRLTGDQRAWLDAFAAAGVEALVWRPADLTGIAVTLGDRLRRAEATMAPVYGAADD